MIKRGCNTVGIDLGTTFSALACVDQQGSPRVVPDLSGNLITPSVIYFDDAGIVVGELAVQQASFAIDRVAQFVKVHIGDEWERVYQGQSYTAESLSAIILKHLVQQAEPQIGPIQSAVITVPAYFTERRRRATQHAGEIAGLRVQGTLNEPMAATLACGLRDGQAQENIVVYDLGGGTFDVTVVRVTAGEIVELATGGNRQLGGKDWDQCLVDFVAERYLQQHGIDPRGDAAAEQILRRECEMAKRRLSQVTTTQVPIAAFDRRVTVDVNRAQFEELTANLLHSTKLTFELAVSDAGLTWEKISRVVLVGGSTQMPAVRRMLEKTAGFPPSEDINPVTAVASGAALYALLLERGTAPQAYPREPTDEKPPDEPAGEQDLTVDFQQKSAAEDARWSYDSRPTSSLESAEPTENDAEILPTIKFVTAHGVGVKVREGDVWKNSVVIHANTPVPVRQTRTFLTMASSRKQSAVKVEITQGDTENAEVAEILGSGLIEGVPPDDPPGQPVEVAMEFDELGRLHVNAVYIPTGQWLDVSLDVVGGLKEQEVADRRRKLAETTILTVFDPDKALQGLAEQDEAEEF